MSIFVKNFFDGRLAVSAERVAGVTFLKIFNKNGRLTRDGGLSPLRCLFFKFAFEAVYTGTPVFSLLRHLFFFGRGSSFFLRFQCGAVLYFCCMARGARFWLCFLLCLGVLGAGLGLPSVGFVNAV